MQPTLDMSYKGEVMATKRIKRPRDPVQLAKLIGDIATGQITDEVEDKRDQAAAELGRKGGKARARKLSAAERSSISKRAAKARWGKDRAVQGQKGRF